MKRRTVFILGAGASCPFHFPSGPQLRDFIIQDIAGINTIGLERRLVRMGFGMAMIKEFAELFRVSQIPSIDAFLQRYPALLPLGTAAISIKIHYHEAANRNWIFDAPDWYRHLLLAIKDDENLHRETLTIITYNYDRSLEYYLQRSLSAALGITPAESKARVDRLNIIHFYGNLGELPAELDGPSYYGVGADVDFISHGEHLHRTLATPDAEKTVDQMAERYVETIRKGAESIHLIGGERAAQEVIERAAGKCADADSIILLGFGFHAENVAPLRPKEWGTDTRNLRLYSTAVEMSPTARERATKLLGREPEWIEGKCRTFFDFVDPFD